MIAHLVSKQLVKLELKSGSRYSRVKMIMAVVYVQPLNASPELKDWYIALETMIEIEKAASTSKKDEVTSKQPLFR